MTTPEKILNTTFFQRMITDPTRSEEMLLNFLNMLIREEWPPTMTAARHLFVTDVQIGTVIDGIAFNYVVHRGDVTRPFRQVIEQKTLMEMDRPITMSIRESLRKQVMDWYRTEPKTHSELAEERWETNKRLAIDSCYRIMTASVRGDEEGARRLIDFARFAIPQAVMDDALKTIADQLRITDKEGPIGPPAG